eukprot:CAMPEP_0202086054 /NCGR_PEP_ID=MMETSP0964-20121228/32420_1 /ASSEMBLY_ACC=CAM_ASM_000500 /TAXON_ID=4773 /ORGANISM="Schizochytrium aggregatum, Strain ATCC28209" /LENGTH=226 /DNA_ID=CAMNT_0048653927 /DNA_START=286 /DNA_END=966 /DNA_ORIENTATION=-
MALDCKAAREVFECDVAARTARRQDSVEDIVNVTLRVYFLRFSHLNGLEPRLERSFFELSLEHVPRSRRHTHEQRLGKLSCQVPQTHAVVATTLKTLNLSSCRHMHVGIRQTVFDPSRVTYVAQRMPGFTGKNILRRERLRTSRTLAHLVHGHAKVLGFADRRESFCGGRSLARVLRNQAIDQVNFQFLWKQVAKQHTHCEHVERRRDSSGRPIAVLRRKLHSHKP